MIISTKEMLLEAQRNKYAVPAFNIHNLETLRAVVETAVEMKSPVIIAATPGTIKYSGLRNLYYLVKSASEEYNVPMAFHLDHHEEIDSIKTAIKLGVKSAMIDASHHDFAKNIEISKEVVNYAHKYDATVEAELGILAGQEDDLVREEKDKIYTNPASAVDFVNKTGIDSLAVAIGTAHGLYHGKLNLDFDRLAEINKVVDVPLVLHGASDVPVDMVQKTIELGICKVNIATDLKNVFIKALREYLDEHKEENDPRKYFSNAILKMKDMVKEKILMCKCNNKM